MLFPKHCPHLPITNVTWATFELLLKHTKIACVINLLIKWLLHKILELLFGLEIQMYTSLLVLYDAIPTNKASVLAMLIYMIIIINTEPTFVSNRSVVVLCTLVLVTNTHPTVTRCTIWRYARITVIFCTETSTCKLDLPFDELSVKDDGEAGAIASVVTMSTKLLLIIIHLLSTWGSVLESAEAVCKSTAAITSAASDLLITIFQPRGWYYEEGGFTPPY